MKKIGVEALWLKDGTKQIWNVFNPCQKMTRFTSAAKQFDSNLRHVTAYNLYDIGIKDHTALCFKFKIVMSSNISPDMNTMGKKLALLLVLVWEILILKMKIIWIIVWMLVYLQKQRYELTNGFYFVRKRTLCLACSISNNRKCSN